MRIGHPGPFGWDMKVKTKWVVLAAVVAGIAGFSRLST